MLLIVAVPLTTSAVVVPDVRPTMTTGARNALQCAVAMLTGEPCERGGGPSPGSDPPDGDPGGPTEGPAIGDGENTGVGPAHFLGRTTNYTVNSDPETAEEIAELGDAGPNPLDPWSIPVGTSITMNEDFREGTELSAAYRSLQTSVGATESERVSSGVERIDASHVRIDVGDSDVLSSWMKLGVGVGPGYLGASSTRTSTEGTMRSVGLATGRLPDHAAKGTSNQTRSEISTWLSKDDLTAKLSGAGVEGELSLTTSDNGGQVQVTRPRSPSTWVWRARTPMG